MWIHICRTDGKLAFDEIRFVVELYEPWDDEAREAFDALLRACKSACYFGGFSGDLLRAAWDAKEIKVRDDGRADRLPPLLVGGWSQPEYGERSVTWQAFQFGAGEPAVRALLDMLWFYHLTVRGVRWIEIG